jgi:mycofactocin precursor
MTQQTLTQAPAAPEAPETTAEPRGGEHAADEALVADELLVEEVSIDGMCGVY